MKASDWIPAHRSLFRGSKKSWPRACRLALLELSLEARLTRGVLEFPPEWDTLKAVHDLIGGNKKEIAQLLRLAAVPDENGVPTFAIERTSTRHALKIVKWGEHAGPKTDATRAADYRDRKKNEQLQSQSRDAPFAGVTVVTPRIQDSTEQKREPPKPPRGLGGETGYELALRVWSPLWSSRYREQFQPNPNTGPKGEQAILMRLGRMAIQAFGNGAEAAFVAKAKGYLADDKPWLVKNRHALWRFEADWASYAANPTAERNPLSACQNTPDERKPLTPEQCAAQLRKFPPPSPNDLFRPPSEEIAS